MARKTLNRKELRAEAEAAEAAEGTKKKKAAKKKKTPAKRKSRKKVAAEVRGEPFGPPPVSLRFRFTLGGVDVVDLVNVVLDWGGDGTVNGGDVTGDGKVDVSDLVAVILAWGPC